MGPFTRGKLARLYERKKTFELFVGKYEMAYSKRSIIVNWRITDLENLERPSLVQGLICESISLTRNLTVWSNTHLQIYIKLDRYRHAD